MEEQKENFEAPINSNTPDKTGGKSIYIGVWKKYATFKGRARRKEYWTFTLCNLIIDLAIYSLLVACNISKLYIVSIIISIILILWILSLIIPSLALFVRRLHDINRSGWWFFIGFVPYVGGIVLLIFMLLNGTTGDNKYGPDPKQISQ